MRKRETRMPLFKEKKPTWKKKDFSIRTCGSALCCRLFSLLKKLNTILLLLWVYTFFWRDVSSVYLSLSCVYTYCHIIRERGKMKRLLAHGCYFKKGSYVVKLADVFFISGYFWITVLLLKLVDLLFPFNQTKHPLLFTSSPTNNIIIIIISPYLLILILGRSYVFDSTSSLLHSHSKRSSSTHKHILRKNLLSSSFFYTKSSSPLKHQQHLLVSLEC